MEKAKAQKKCKSFTLIELLVVMVVIIIMIGITIPVSRYVSLRAKEAREKTIKEQIINALEDYRAEYGEYPIPGDPKHYPTNYCVTNVLEYNYCPFTHADLATTNTFTNTVGDPAFPQLIVTNAPYAGIEVLPFALPYYIVYRLTYPLMLGQLERGKEPFMTFPEKTICYVVYARRFHETTGKALDIVEHEVWGTTRDGEPIKIATTTAVQGRPVNRVKAVSPAPPYQQWWYECTDGLTYTLTPTNPGPWY